MQTRPQHSYRAVIKRLPETESYQLPIVETIGLKARNARHAIACALAVTGAAVIEVYRQDRGAA